MAALIVRARNQDGSSGDVLMTVSENGDTISVDGDGAIADSFRTRRNPPPVTATDPQQRLIQFIGSISTYWSVDFVPGSLSAPGLLDFEYDESKHPRDARGRWGSGAGGELPVDILDMLQDWVYSGDKAMLIRHAADGVSLPGEYPHQAARLIDVIDHAPPTTETLYRGVAISGDVAAMFQPGEEVHISLGSFSADTTQAEKFAQWASEADPTATEVVFHLEPGAQGLAIPYDKVLVESAGHVLDPVAEKAMWSDEKETIVHGDFTVVSAEPTTFPAWANMDSTTHRGLSVTLRAA